ncbi:MAG: DUF2188 domain-containing protein [Mycoplasma sp.]|nr:DUF2188 domain-containing protein [Mycoplasma sp.]
MIKYIVHHEGKWAVKNGKAGRPTKILDTQKEAIHYAASLKNATSILVQSRSGTFRKISKWDVLPSNNTSGIKKTDSQKLTRVVMPKLSSIHTVKKRNPETINKPKKIIPKPIVEEPKINVAPVAVEPKNLDTQKEEISMPDIDKLVLPEDTKKSEVTKDQIKNKENETPFVVEPPINNEINSKKTDEEREALNSFLGLNKEKEDKKDEVNLYNHFETKSENESEKDSLIVSSTSFNNEKEKNDINKDNKKEESVISKKEKRAQKEAKASSNDSDDKKEKKHFPLWVKIVFWVLLGIIGLTIIFGILVSTNVGFAVDIYDKLPSWLQLFA